MEAYNCAERRAFPSTAPDSDFAWAFVRYSLRVAHAILLPTHATRGPQGALDFTLDDAHVHGNGAEGEQLLYPAKRHYPVNPDDSGKEPERVAWRLKERMRTVSVALVACLNIRVDPPDVIKPSPCVPCPGARPRLRVLEGADAGGAGRCARLECWTDPYSMSAPKVPPPPSTLLRRTLPHRTDAGSRRASRPASATGPNLCPPAPHGTPGRPRPSRHRRPRAPAPVGRRWRPSARRSNSSTSAGRKVPKRTRCQQPRSQTPRRGPAGACRRAPR